MYPKLRLGFRAGPGKVHEPFKGLRSIYRKKSYSQSNVVYRGSGFWEKG